jgi:hypothetical protein
MRVLALDLGYEGDWSLKLIWNIEPDGTIKAQTEIVAMRWKLGFCAGPFEKSAFV